MYCNTGSVIKKKLIFSASNLGKANLLNIAYGIDKNFFLGCAISITSILLTNPDNYFNFHIFTNYINDDFERKIEQLANDYNTCITIYLMDDNSLSKLPTTTNWTVATYFRFIVADYFFNKIDKILYLDADILCKGDLSELFTLKFDNKIAYVVIEKDLIWWNKCATRLNEKKLSSGYFNAGFLLINLEAWKAYDVNNKALELLSNENLSRKFTHLDQDVLNIILLDKIKYLDKKYNQQVNINYELKNKINKNFNFSVTKETILIHYIGPTKPWHEWAKDYKLSKYFLNVKEKSPWATVHLLQANTPTQMRYCAKHLLHQKKLFSSIFCYIKYYFYKIKTQKLFKFSRKIL